MKKIKMSNKVYDIMKRLVCYVLPALATMIIGLGEVWNWSWAVPVAATVTIITTFLGSALCISSKNYDDETSEKK